MNLRDVTLSVATRNYVIACRGLNLSPKTMRSYTDILKAFVNFTGDIYVRELTPDLVRAYMASLSQKMGRYADRDGVKKFSSHSMLKHYQVIRTWIRWMYKQDELMHRIIEGTDPPRLGKRLPSRLSDDELDTLFRHLREQGRFRDLVIFEVFLDTGLRLAELSSLNLSDVNLDQGWIHVASGKGDREGIASIGNQACRDLHTYIYMERRARPDEQALFINRNGFRFEYEGIAGMVRRELSEVLSRPGKRGAHTLRHTMATNYIRAGGDVEELRRLLRQTDIKVTQQYVDLANDDLLAAHHGRSLVDQVKQRTRRR